MPAPSLLRRHRLLASLAFVVLHSLFAVLHAQDPSDTSWKQMGGMSKGLMFAGTSIQTNGQNWAYLLWQPGDDSLLEGRTLALYRKPGNTAAVAPYALETVLSFSWDARTAAAVLKRGESVGDDLTQLENALHSNFRDVLPPSTAGLPEKALFCIQSAMQKPDLLGNLGLLARKHPALSMLMGRSYASQLPVAGSVTYELRDYDVAKKTDKAVIGRVTVTAGQPTVLPAPGTPFDVKPMPGTEPSAHLAVRLRWSTPNELRQLSILHFGCNVYRLPKSYVDQHAFPLIGPTLAQLKAAVAAQAPARAVNLMPVLGEDLDDQAAISDDDRQMVFFIDDNDGLKANGTPLRNGDEFYYFVCARDLLGRDGTPSNARYVKVCDWMPPLPPGRVKIEPEYAYNGNAQAPGGSQHFRVSWFDAGISSGTNGSVPNANESASGFYLYRWASIQAISDFGGQMDPQTGAVSAGAGNHAFFVGSVERQNNAWIFRPAGGVPVAGNVTVTNILGLDRFSIIDALGPKTPDDTGKSYTYTVRAYDNGACGRNVSGDSGPALGSPLDLSTSAATASGTLTTRRLQPSLVAAAAYDAGDAPDWRLWGRFEVNTANLKTAAWADFEWPAGTFLGRVNFGDNGISNVESAVLERIFDSPPGGKPRCRVRLRNGTETGWIENAALVPEPPPIGTGDANKKNKRKAAPWTFSVVAQEHIWVPGQPGPIIDEPVIGGGLQATPRGTLVLPAGTQRWRMYRSVDGGPKRLIAQGTGEVQANWTDSQPPAQANVICYYSQVDMGYGKVGPITPHGECIVRIADAEAMPVPTLTQLARTTLSDGSPAMRVQWQCPPYGFERFEVLIIKGGSLPPASAGTDLSSELSGPYDAAMLDVDGGWPPMGVYQTIRVAAMAGYPRNDFSALVPVTVASTYAVAVRCVGKGPFRGADANHPGRVHGEESEMKLFTWEDQTAIANQAPAANGSLPWPARGLPPLLPVDVRFAARVLHDQQGAPDKRFGPLVCIGQVSGVTPVGLGGAISNTAAGGVISTVPASLDPHASLFPIVDRVDAKQVPDRSRKCGFRYDVTVTHRDLFPCILYRRAVSSDRFPVADQYRDWVQVTPLMEQIAYEKKVATTVIHDPWVVFTSVESAGSQLWLVDRHPVVIGMTYEYSLVLMDQRTKEMHGLLPLGKVTVQ